MKKPGSYILRSYDYQLNSLSLCIDTSFVQIICDQKETKNHSFSFLNFFISLLQAEQKSAIIACRPMVEKTHNVSLSSDRSPQWLAKQGKPYSSEIDTGLQL